MIERSPGRKMKGVLNAFGDVLLCPLDRPLKPLAARKVRRDAGRISAAGAVRRHSLDLFGFQFQRRSAVEKNISRILRLQMTALGKHRTTEVFEYFLCGGFQRGDRVNRLT